MYVYLICVPMTYNVIDMERLSPGVLSSHKIFDELESSLIVNKYFVPFAL